MERSVASRGGERPASPKRPRTETAAGRSPQEREEDAPACPSEVYMAVATAGSRVGVAWYDAAVGEVRPRPAQCGSS